MLHPDDWQALLITLQLALVSTVILLVLGVPLAWWLHRLSASWLKALLTGLVALPLVLPPTVLGFYLLLLLSPAGSVGSWWLHTTGTTLAFSFSGLVIGSVIFSLPFVVQPLMLAMQQQGDSLRQAGAVMGLSPWQCWWRMLLPSWTPAMRVAAALAFAHTLGEFGLVLMIGGNLPGETRVASIQIYQHVETLNYAGAHALSAWLIGLCLLLLVPVLHKTHASQAGARP